MTPERAQMILAGVLKSLQLFADELEDLETRCPCPEARHLRQAVEQMRLSLQQLLARS